MLTVFTISFALSFLLLGKQYALPQRVLSAICGATVFTLPFALLLS